MAATPSRAPDTSRPVLVVAAELDSRLQGALAPLNPIFFKSGAEALDHLSNAGLLFVHSDLSDMKGADFIRQARRRTPDALFIPLDGVSETRVRLDAMLNAMQDPVFALDLSGRCRSFYWGRANDFGVRPEELIGKTVREILDADSAAAVQALMERVFETRRSQTEEIPVSIRKWTLTFEVTLSPLMKHSVVGIAHDVTEQRKMEWKFQQALRMELAGRLASAFAHDFNNLLSSILLKTELALSTIPADGEIYKELDGIRMESLVGAELTRRLLGLVRRQPPQPTILDMDETIEGMLPMLRHLIADNIELRHRRTPRLWSIRADPAHIEQILFNLALNARDAMPRGGRLTIETGNLVLDDGFAREILQRPGGDYAMLSVCDSGLGMNKEVQSHLFEPFFTTKGHGRGTGLGLACILDISQQHDAAIVIHSQPGRGTRVEIYFPRASIAEATLKS